MPRIHHMTPTPHPYPDLKQEAQRTLGWKSVSIGSEPVEPDPSRDDHCYPAQVANIQLVRLFEARRMVEQSRLAVNHDPEEAGMLAAESGRARSTNPFIPFSDEHAEWDRGFMEY